MNPIKAAVWNFWYTLSNAETIAVYRFAIAKTWELLKRAAQLVLLLFLFAVTVSVWLWAVSFHGGRSLRVWLETKNPTLPEVLSAGKNLFSQVFNSIWKWTQSQLKNRFGIEVKLPSLPEFQQLETVQGNSSSAIVTEPSKK
jgi:hypothetical protein